MVPVTLHFEDSGDWYSLPQWAEYFISVGKLLASADRSGSRLVTAIVVPTRAFGAAFVSLGMVISDAATRDCVSAAAHFETLFDLPPGTPVVYRPKQGRTLKGVLLEPVEIDGQLFVPVQVHAKEGGALRHLVPESTSLQVRPAHHSGKLPKTQSGRDTRFANHFVDTLLGETDSVQLGLHSALSCAIIGRSTALEHEIRRTPLALHANGHLRGKGYLQDLLRVDRFVSDRETHRSTLIPIAGRPPAAEVVNSVELGVVFDGALGFLKWGDLWHSRHLVVILDRTEPYFDDAISAINARFSQNHTSGDPALPPGDAPDGGEVLSFREPLK